jgi:hypothetical protein
MKLELINAEETGRNAKATIHSSGKLGFSAEAVGLLDIKEGKFIQFARNVEDPTDRNLYAFLLEKMQKGALRINKAGAYYSVKTKKMFDSMNEDYIRKRIIFDLTKGEYDGKPFIKMLRREIPNKRLIKPED